MFQMREVEAFLKESLDDEVQEGRWRTTMQRSINKNHSLLMSRMDELSKNHMHELHKNHTLVMSRIEQLARGLEHVQRKLDGPPPSANATACAQLKLDGPPPSASAPACATQVLWRIRPTGRQCAEDQQVAAAPSIEVYSKPVSGDSLHTNGARGSPARARCVAPKPPRSAFSQIRIGP
jgi:hypothetical protein